MFKTPYETTLCSGMSVASIVRQLQRSLVSDLLILSDSIKGTDVKGVLVVPPSNTEVAQFKHPILFKSAHLSITESWMVAVYGKGWVQEDTRTHSFRIPNSYDSGIPLFGAAISKAWINNGPLDLLAISGLVGRVFSRWITGVLGQRELLNPEAMKWVSVYTALYWLMLFEETPVDLSSDLVLRRYTNKLGVITRVNADEIFIRFREEEFGPILNIHSLVELLKRADPIRLARLDIGVLYSYLQNTFMGAAHRESVAIALEYPPLFHALALQALGDRSYRKTKIAELLEAAPLAERQRYQQQMGALITV